MHSLASPVPFPREQSISGEQARVIAICLYSQTEQKAARAYTGRTMEPNACRRATMQQQDLCVHLSTSSMPKGDLGLLSIPHGDMKFRKPPLMPQNICLDLLKEVSSPAAGHHFLMRSCCPPSSLLEPRGKLCPPHTKLAGTAGARAEGARASLPDGACSKRGNTCTD